jgi:hypothetical protein
MKKKYPLANRDFTTLSDEKLIEIMADLEPAVQALKNLGEIALDESSNEKDRALSIINLHFSARYAVEILNKIADTEFGINCIKENVQLHDSIPAFYSPTNKIYEKANYERWKKVPFMQRVRPNGKFPIIGKDKLTEAKGELSPQDVIRYAIEEYISIRIHGNSVNNLIKQSNGNKESNKLVDEDLFEDFVAEVQFYYSQVSKEVREACLLWQRATQCYHQDASKHLPEPETEAEGWCHEEKVYHKIQEQVRGLIRNEWDNKGLKRKKKVQG